MAKRKVRSEGKKNIIKGLLEEYDIQSAEDIQDALADLLGETIGDMVESEATEHLGYEKHKRNDSNNARNGIKKKKVRSEYGEIELDIPQDRNGTFNPKVVKKRQKDISAIDDKIISMYANGLSTRQISEQIEDIYGFDVSESLVSDITDTLMPQIEEWQVRPLSEIYPIVFIDAIHYSVRDDGVVKKLAAYVVLGIDSDGMKEVMGLLHRAE